MKFILALFLPWLALLISGRPISAIISAVVWVASIVLVFVMGIGVVVHIFNVIGACFLISAKSQQKLQKEIKQLKEARPSED